MHCDLHIHMVLDGVNWRAAINTHREAPCVPLIRARLEDYRARGITYLRDGGDRFGASECAKRLAPEYGITYLTPTFPICMKGRYGSFIGRTFEDFDEYKALIKEAKARGPDFIKLMLSGIMDFDHYGVITSAPPEDAQIHDMIACAHDAGFRVMAHVNGAHTAAVAAQSRVDSIEHGAYLDDEALHAMYENDVLWVPTLVTIANLIGNNRYDNAVLRRLLATQEANLRAYKAMGGRIGIGSDAGAFRVLHGYGALEEEHLLQKLLYNRQEETQWSFGMPI